MREIDFEGLNKLRLEIPGLTLLDCRAGEYWLWETIEGSANIRWKEISRRAPRLLPDKNQAIVTFCQSPLCGASSKAYHALEELEYSNLYEYIGGVEDWRTRGGKIAKNPNHRIGNDAFRFPDQKFYGQPVGSYLVEDESKIILIDGPQSLTDANEDFILSFSKPISIFLTHGSTGGVAAMLHDIHGADIYLHRGDLGNEWLTCNPTHVFDDSFDFSDNLRVIHTPGHSPGSCCLYDSRSGLLFSGDHVQGDSVGAVWDFVVDEEERGDLAQQMASLRSLADLELSAVYPFHYQPMKDSTNELLKAFILKYQNL